MTSGTWPVMSGIGPVMSGTGPKMSGMGPKNLVTFRTLHNDVRNIARINWPYSAHRTSMSGTGPGETGPIPDITQRCPEYDQKEKIDVRNMASDVRNVLGSLNVRKSL